MKCCDNCRMKIRINGTLQCIAPAVIRWGQMVKPDYVCELWEEEGCTS